MDMTDNTDEVTGLIPDVQASLSEELAAMHVQEESAEPEEYQEVTPAEPEVEQEVAPSAADISAHLEHELQELKLSNQSLQDNNLHLSQKITTLLDDTVSKEFYQQKVSELEEKVAAVTEELRVTKAQQQRNESQAKSYITKLQQDVKVKEDNLQKALDEVKKEKESMVLKFAQSEQKQMDMQKSLRSLDFQCKETQKERDNALNKVRLTQSEKEKLQSLADQKTIISAQLEKEISRLKESLASADVKVKWAHNKVKEEQENHKETVKKLDEALKMVSHTKEECETLRKTYSDVVTQFQESEEFRSNNLDSQLKKTVEELEHHKQEKTDINETHQKLAKELEVTKKQVRDVQTEIRQLREKYKLSEAERMCQQETANRTRESLAKVTEESVKLRHTLKQCRGFEENFRQAQQQLEVLKKELADSKLTFKDQEGDLLTLRSKESELLEFTQKISDRNAGLQAENLTLMNQLTTERDQNEELKKEIKTLSELKQKLEIQVKSLGDNQNSELGDLTEQLAVKSKLVEDLTLQVEEEQNTIKTLKRKHGADIKDLKRQLTTVKRKLDGGGTCNNNLNLKEQERPTCTTDGQSLGSRTSSNSSLVIGDNNRIVPVPQRVSPSIDYTTSCMNTDADRVTNDDDSSVYTGQTLDYKVIEPDRQVLIEKIVKLQRDRSKKNEKIDFLAEHIRQLTEEVQKKNKLLQHYMLREESGSITPEAFDVNKDALSRKGGIMASVHTTHSADKNMTLEFSLEINKKLQAVLEDSLLKNITLKDNIATLGGEIARLTEEKQLPRS